MNYDPNCNLVNPTYTLMPCYVNDLPHSLPLEQRSRDPVLRSVHAVSVNCKNIGYLWD